MEHTPWKYENMHMCPYVFPVIFLKHVFIWHVVWHDGYIKNYGRW